MTGFVNINKPSGIPSSKETSYVKKLTGVPCGHMGTLDPMAEGVLPVGIGNACRLFDYLLDKRKTYRAVFTFGVDSDTLDTTGNILKSGEYVPTIDEIKRVLPSFTGVTDQVPPAYSAKNVNGRRSYELARKGVKVDLAPRKVEIFSIRAEKLTDCDYAFEIECGGGTYIRSLARDVAAKLGTYAVMSALTRTASGSFAIEDSVRSDDLTADNIEGYIIPTENVISYESVRISGTSETWLLNGRAVPCGEEDGYYKVFLSTGFYGIGEAKNQKLKIRTKLC